MRRYIFLIALLLPAVSHSQDIAPDHNWSCSDAWYKYGVNFYNYQGNLYTVKYHDNGIYNGAYPYFYIMNKYHDYASLTDFDFGSPAKNYIDYFGYWGEGGCYYRPPLIGRNFFFQYDGSLWYFQEVQCSFTDDDHWTPADESYECFAQIPTDGQGTVSHYYTTNSPTSTRHKQAAFQLDTNLFFIAVETSNKNGEQNYWYLQQYTYNESNNRFTHVTDILFSYQATGFGGYIKRMDTLQSEYVIINTYMPGVESNITYLIPDYTSNTIKFFIDTYGGLSGVAASTIVNGAIKGGKSTDASPTLNDRFVEFGIDQNKSSDGNHHVHYVEHIIDHNNHDSLFWGNTGTVTLPSSSYPATVGGTYDILGSYELVPKDFSSMVTGPDGFQQQTWFFYPNKDGHFQGAQFVSDQWKLLDNDWVESDDISNDSLYPGIRSLWTLTGIVDGPPPASINWPVWGNYHDATEQPTTLSFESSLGSDTEIDNSYEDQWSIGEDLDLTRGKKKLEGSFSEQFNYSNAFKNVIGHDTLIKTSYTSTFGMNENSQQSGFFIYTIPHIQRFHYQKYPWWTPFNSNEYPIRYSDQFRFCTTGTSTYNDSIPIGRFPFLVNDPNAADMRGWGSDSARHLLVFNAANSDVGPLFSLSWSSPSNGSHESYVITTTTSTSYANTDTYNVQSSLGVKIPKIFDLKVTGGYQVSYGNETTTKTTFGQKIDASMSNMMEKSQGVNNSYVETAVYWLKPESNPDWWFYDSLGGCKPWYIAYAVGDYHPKIRLLSPAGGSTIETNDLVFSWNAEEEQVGDYTFYLLSTPMVAPEYTIFKKKVGALTQCSAEGFVPGPGKTYYWAVSGMSGDRMPVWSVTGKFTMKEESLSPEDGGLKAAVFPNPATSGGFRMLVDTRDGGTIQVYLYDIRGNLAAVKEFSGCPKGASSLDLTGTLAEPGVYLAEIRSASGRLMRKVVIQ